jgi:hypothetical protein
MPHLSGDNVIHRRSCSFVSVGQAWLFPVASATWDPHGGKSGSVAREGRRLKLASHVAGVSAEAERGYPRVASAARRGAARCDAMRAEGAEGAICRRRRSLRSAKPNWPGRRTREKESVRGGEGGDAPARTDGRGKNPREEFNAWMKP